MRAKRRIYTYEKLMANPDPKVASKIIRKQTGRVNENSNALLIQDKLETDPLLQAQAWAEWFEELGMCEKRTDYSN